MPRKGKSKDELKKHETEFKGKRINLKRFAYDVFAYSARKFHVREENICVWTDNENDYGHADFFLKVTRLIISRQIKRRFDLHKQFKKYHESNEMDSLKSICASFQEVIKTEIEDPNDRMHIFLEVEASLCVGCELIAFLDSVKSPLYVKDLAIYWFESFHLSKKRFLREGGLNQLYMRRAALPNAERMDAVLEHFIPAHCLPYEVSALNAELEGNLGTTLAKYRMKASSSPDDQPVHPPSVGDDRVPSGLDVVHFLPTKSDEVSGLDILRRLGAPVAETPFQNLFGTSYHKPVRSRKDSSDQQGNRNREDTFSSLEQVVGQLSLDSAPTKLSSVKTPGVPASIDPASSQSFADATSKEPTKQPEGLSGKQKIKSSSDTYLEQGFGRLNLDSSRLGSHVSPGLGALPLEGFLRGFGSQVAEKLTQNFLRESPQKSVRRRKGRSDQHGRRNREDSFSSVEQGLGQLDLDTLAEKQSNQEKPVFSKSRYLVPSENFPREKSKEIPEKQSQSLPSEKSKGIPEKQSQSLPSEKSKGIPEKQSQSLPSVRPKEFFKKPKRKSKKNN